MLPGMEPGPRVIGMLGGMSWESSAAYYRLANELVAQRRGGLASAQVLLRSLDFAVVERLQAAGDWPAAARLLTEAARGLQAGGAGIVLLCTNTMHLVADQVQQGIDVPLLHLADVTAAAVTAAGLHRVGLLGTAFTMEQPFYRERLAGHGLSVLVPPAPDRREVHRVIYQELCRGRFTEPSRELFRAVIERLVQAGAQGVVLGCTEIELLVGSGDSSVPLFPTTALHVAAAVDWSLSRVGA